LFEHETVFTASIDYVSITTGISAVERGLTIRKLTDENTVPSDFRRPRHVFPLISKDNGVLERNGHTEATVDLMKIANLKELGICVEIMSEDGNMMTKKELQKNQKNGA